MAEHDLLAVADEIATRNIKRGWFESFENALSRRIILRGEIYLALCEIREAAMEAGR